MAVFGTAQTVGGQTGKTSSYTTDTLERLEAQTDQFKKSLVAAFEWSPLKGTPVENNFAARLAIFEIVVDGLRQRRAGDNEIIASAVESVLRQGFYLEIMMSLHATSPEAKRDWTQIKNTLDGLAQTHNIAWEWQPDKNPGWRNVSLPGVFDRLEKRAGEFRDRLDEALDASPLDETRAENAANDLVKTFEERVDRFGRRVNRGGELAPADAAKLLVKAIMIDKFMRDHEFPSEVRRSWSRIKANLDELALKNNIIWRWTVQPAIPTGFRN